MILSDLEDEEELLATTIDSIEDVVANKVPVETQFQKFVEEGARQGWPKKGKKYKHLNGRKYCRLSIYTSTPISDPNHIGRNSKDPLHKPSRHMQKCYAKNPKG